MERLGEMNGKSESESERKGKEIKWRVKMEKWKWEKKFREHKIIKLMKKLNWMNERTVCSIEFTFTIKVKRGRKEEKDLSIFFEEREVEGKEFKYFSLWKWLKKKKKR